eukprot:TRINITY_DN738_c0_g1_i2.p1 TRINITY_DN738_c0_g1~~TRINITY_DN738_c0_g1_i2.p1  ORF type:complete len:183 (+),score=32.03 TRINITY_DN738_c0_g1_i2:203-751(+)
MDDSLNVLKATWKPIEFQVQELYFLSRIGGDPFEITHVVPFGVKETAEDQTTTPVNIPFFGPNYKPADEEHARVLKTVVIAGLPPQALSAEDLKTLFAEQANSFFQFPQPHLTEMIFNPDGKTRGVGLAELNSPEEVEWVVKNWNYQPFNGFVIYLRPLHSMAFPCFIGHCCSLHSADSLLG